MKEIMIAYWSGTGNTAAMAAILGKGIQDGGICTSIIEVQPIKRLSCICSWLPIHGK